MKTYDINVMATLDKFGYRELDELGDLINAYKEAGYNGMAQLPATFENDGVYPDFNPQSGLVFLTNTNYQALVLTDYGVMEFYVTAHSGKEGTLFDLAEQLESDLTIDGNVFAYTDQSEWKLDDLTEVLWYYHLCISDLATSNVSEQAIQGLYTAKYTICKSLMLAVADDEMWSKATLDELSTDELMAQALYHVEHELDMDEYELLHAFLVEHLNKLTDEQE